MRNQEEHVKNLISSAEEFVDENPNFAVLYLERIAEMSDDVNYRPIEKKYNFTVDEARKEIDNIRSRVLED